MRPDCKGNQHRDTRPCILQVRGTPREEKEEEGTGNSLQCAPGLSDDKNSAVQVLGSAGAGGLLREKSDMRKTTGPLQEARERGRA